MKKLTKLTAEQEAAIRDNGEYAGGWNMYPKVDADEAQALRNGKPYRVTQFDKERLAYVYDMGFQGDPDTDPLVIKCLAKGYIVENPRYIAERAEYDAKIAEAVAKYGPGNYSFGVGFGCRRWILTDAGKAFIRQIGIE